MSQTLFADWITDFRKILATIAILALGFYYNINEPNALAIAVIVQGISNIDSYWDYLRDEKIDIALKIMLVIAIFFSFLAVLVAIFDFAGSKQYFSFDHNNSAGVYILCVGVAIAFPIILLVTDGYFNIKKNKPVSENIDGGDEDEL